MGTVHLWIGVYGSGLRVKKLIFLGVEGVLEQRTERLGVQGAGFRVWGSGCRVQGVGFRVQGAGFRVQGVGFRVQGSGRRVQGSGCRAQGSGFSVQGSGFRVQVSGEEDQRGPVHCYSKDFVCIVKFETH